MKIRHTFIQWICFVVLIAIVMIFNTKHYYKPWNAPASEILPQAESNKNSSNLEDGDGQPEVVQIIPACNCTRKTFLSLSTSAWDSLKMYNSSCSDDGTHYWNHQKVVSFSLHLPNKADAKRIKLYKDGIKVNLERMREYYPGYTMRLYTDVELEGDYCQFICDNSDLFWCDIRNTPSLGNQSQMFFATWRFLVLGDPTVDIFLSRDLDSAIISREAAVVHDWLEIENRKPFHLMRDKNHSHNVPILAGMWGGINYLLPGPEMETAVRIRNDIVNMSRTLSKYKSRDQDILNKVIFYSMNDSIVAYDCYHCKYWGKFTLVKPFPQKRHDSVSDFVGNYELGTKKYPELPKCPVECRPSYGKDWVYC